MELRLLLWPYVRFFCSAYCHVYEPGRVLSAEKRISDWSTFGHTVERFWTKLRSEELIDLEAQRNVELRLCAWLGVDVLPVIALRFNMPLYPAVAACVAVFVRAQKKICAVPSANDLHYKQYVICLH